MAYSLITFPLLSQNPTMTVPGVGPGANPTWPAPSCADAEPAKRHPSEMNLQIVFMPTPTETSLSCQESTRAEQPRNQGRSPETSRDSQMATRRDRSPLYIGWLPPLRGSSQGYRPAQ